MHMLLARQMSMVGAVTSWAISTSGTKGAKPPASDLKLDSPYNDFGSSTRMSWQTCLSVPIEPTKNSVYERHTPQIGSATHWIREARHGSRTTHSCVLPFQCVDHFKSAIHLVNGAVWDGAKPRGWIQVSTSGYSIEGIIFHCFCICTQVMTM